MSQSFAQTVKDSIILVTGGAGFIGSHLMEQLLAAGAARVIAVDNVRYGSWRNIPDDVRFERAALDIAALSVDGWMDRLAGVDYLFHLAAEKHNQALDVPGRVLDVNVDGTFRLFHAAASAGVKKVVFTSSLYANGRMHLPPMSETDLPQPRTVYGISKLTGEHLLAHEAAARNLRGTALRLFFVYGPKQFAGTGYKSVIVRNFERILRGEAPVIFGDGTQALDYIHVSDVVRALITALRPEADGAVINIGSGRAVSVNDLTEEMLRVAGSSLRPVHGAADATAGTFRVCQNELARQLLDWNPSVPLPDGLAGVYAWMKAQW